MTQPVSASTSNYYFPTHGDYEGNRAIAEFDATPDSRIWESSEGMGFLDFLDVINPLQHIPIVSTIYRAITGDEIGLASRLAGGLLFNGPAGVLFAGLSAAFEDATGGDSADHLVALVRDLTGADSAETEQIAAAALVGNAGYSAPAMNGPNTAGRASGDTLAAVAPGGGARPTMPSAGVPPVAGDELTAAETADARIRHRIAEAQRAQTSLLLASLKTGDARFAQPETKPRDGDEPAVPQPRANLLPDDSQSDWFSQAMERGLDKYRQNQALNDRDGNL